MTERISFGANGCSESCKFWIYHQQNKGRDKNLINQTKMTKIRDLIEKIWWVIPPIIVVFGIPLYFALDEMTRFSRPISLFFWCYTRNLPAVPEIFMSFGFLGGIILIFFFLGFMGIGYYSVRKQPSLLLRIIIVSILGIIGFFAGTILMSMMGAH